MDWLYSLQSVNVTVEGTVTIRFLPSQKEISIPSGMTILEGIRLAGLPLGSSCDGQGACGFCRVIVLQGQNNLSFIEEKEAKLLARIEGSSRERIACLAKVWGSIEITTTYW